MLRTLALSATFTLGLTLMTGIAGAQSPPPADAPAAPAPSAAPDASPAARAEVLFNEGIELVDAKSYEAARAKLEESQKLDPAPGTLFNIATCEENLGRFATAAQRWREGAALLPVSDSRRAAAEKNAVDDEGKAGHLVLRASPQAPSNMAVTVDDRATSAADIGRTMVVNPGSHRVVVTAAGYEPRELTITAASGETREVALSPGPAIPPPSATTGPVATAPSPQPPATAPFSFGSFASQHKASFATLGAGLAVAAVGVGVVSQVGPMFSETVAKCNEVPGTCTQEDFAPVKDQATIGNALFVVAGAAGTAAAVLFLFGEDTFAKPASTKMAVGIGPSGVRFTLTR
ncbi:MAG: hypothetical protein R3B70_38650 [Polyangiaceae bacterium]